jgi:uncharacterized RDD family membrane protein YckC
MLPGRLRFTAQVEVAMSNPDHPRGRPDFALPSDPNIRPPLAQPGHATLPSTVGLRAQYAPWGKRVIAMLIDQFPAFIGLIIFFVGYVFFLLELSSGASSWPSTGLVLMIIGILASLAALGWTIYNRWMVAGRTGQSWGKRVTGISLISEQTSQPIGPPNAFLRDLVHILDAVAYVGYLWPLWDDKRQTFADMLVNTIVIHAPESPSH